MSLLFISDLHLKCDMQATVDHFRIFCEQLQDDVQALYILGDLFEMWIGDDDLDVFASEIIRILREVTDREIAVYFQHGNRDFFISHRFAELTHCQLLPEKHLLMFKDKRILLMHGDTLCIHDVAYQKSRKLFRNPWLQWLFLRLPLGLRRILAKRIRNKSLHYTKTQLPEKMDVVQSAVLLVMDEVHADMLIHGHTHREGMHDFLLNGKEVKRVVLPAWHDHAEALLLKDNGDITWVPIY